MDSLARPDPAASPPSEPALAKALRYSRYARHLIAAEPELASELEEGLQRPFDAREMQAFLDCAPPADESALHETLRRLRKRVMLRVIARDLGGLAQLEEVTASVGALADCTIRFALGRLDAALRARHGNPIGAESGAAQELLVVGMGKLGGAELNVSSDVDLVLVYPEDGDTDGAQRISNHEYFARLARKLVSSLNDTTASGFVFRVDLRLRPYGESGPLVASFAMLENYFVTQGREWERYAWLKARAITGRSQDGLEQLVRPFVFRKYLDFGAFASMREMHAQIRREVRRREMHDNIKLGPGGIREIEFIVQAFQLIRGGRDAELRIRPTLEALAQLGARRLLAPEAIAELRSAYVFLRNLEHRLQYLDDQQTQSLPRNREDHALVAEAMGFSGYTAFLRRLAAHRAKVTRSFEAIFAAVQEPEHPLAALWAGADDLAAARLAELGYRDAARIADRLQRMRQAGRYRELPAQSQARFDALIPRLLEASAACPDPDETLERLLQLLEAVSRRGAYLALLIEYPQALEALARLVGASRWACDYLIAHPILLDELLDARLLHAAPDWPRLATELDRHLQDAGSDIERKMDILRHVRHAQTFRLLAQDLAGLLPVETLSDHLSDLADLVLERTIRMCWQDLRARHREDPCFAVIGYGKLGGKELGYASDLDIIFLYDDAAAEAPEVYAKLAQRVNLWLTSLTPAGVLYETDLQLRPDGASGLLVSSVEAFEEYQRRKAWVWEHQALTRARFAAGDARIGDRFERVRNEVLSREREIGALRQEIAAMREKMHRAHPNASGLFDIKHDRGGIVDVEFAVQFLVLAHAHAHADLLRNSGNLALLRCAAGLGLIPAPLAESVCDAYRQYRRWQHQIRLQGEAYARIDAARAEPHAGAVTELWRRAFG
ncbi:MAG: bifunctional [glutamate--ammonia ligase]-adenylyl-L-tyrosine phosphorylase/[glutamate--ammonia-ligase] adenylyltransferase [Burkholderiales bacterium]